MRTRFTTFQAPDYNFGMLPPLAAAAARAVCARATEACPALVRTHLLSVLSSAVAPLYVMSPPNWTPIPIGVNTLCIADVGGSKSPVTAYATSWNSGFQWQDFFHQLIPLAGIALSVLILVSIYAATWAQDNCLREQQRIIGKIRDALELPESAAIALEAYERTMVANRRNAAGKRIGHRIHALVRVTPIVLPVGFALLWIYAYLFAPALT